MTHEQQITETIVATGGRSITFGYEPVMKLQAVRFRECLGTYTTRYGFTWSDLQERITCYAQSRLRAIAAEMRS